MEKQLQEKLKEIKVKIKANSKDVHFAETLIEEFVSLQKQADVEAVELIVPCSEVEHKHQIDDVTSLIKTVHGYLYKHGELSYVYVPFGFNKLYDAMAELDDLLSQETRTEDEDTIISMMQRMLQWHTVAFADTEALIDSATATVKILGDVIKRNLPSETVQETESDIMANAEFLQENKVFEELVNTPIPKIE